VSKIPYELAKLHGFVVFEANHQARWIVEFAVVANSVAGKQDHRPLVVRDYVFDIQVERIAGKFGDLGEKGEDRVAPTVVAGQAAVAAGKTPNGVVGKRARDGFEVSFPECPKQRANARCIRMLYRHIAPL
jgi:hypothetical protein